MNTSPVVVLVLALIASSYAGMRSRSRLADAFKLAPEFSHKSNGIYVPQNIDVFEAIESTAGAMPVPNAEMPPTSNANIQGNQGIAMVPGVMIQRKPSKKPSAIANTGLNLPMAVSPVKGGIKQTGHAISGVGMPTQLGLTKPIKIEQKGLALPIQISRKSVGGISTGVAGKPVMSKPIGQIKPVMGKPIGQVKPGMGKPIGQIKPGMGKPVGQIKPVSKPSANTGPKFQTRPAGKPIRTSPVANDRLVNKLFGNENTGTNMQRKPSRRPHKPTNKQRNHNNNQRKPNNKPNNRSVNRRQACGFNIPSFLLPDTRLSQREFEKMYLLPALRAHLTATQCRSRALTIYIDWLLHLRIQNYNV